MAQKIYIVMYHYTRNLIYSRYPRLKGLAYDLFEKQLQFFKKNFSVVNMQDVMDTIQKNGGGGAAGKCTPFNF